MVTPMETSANLTELLIPREMPAENPEVWPSSILMLTSSTLPHLTSRTGIALKSVPTLTLDLSQRSSATDRPPAIMQ